MKKTKTVFSVAAVLLIFLIVLGLTDRLLQPKYMTDLTEGSMTAQYYREAGGHDVIFIGDCEVYANFSPMELYRQQGICMQWHMAVKRNTCQRLYQQYGTDCGADTMGEAVSVESIAHLLNSIEQTLDAKGQKDLPYTILYCLNPSMRDAMCSLAASFRNVHCGAAWWFLDHRQGIWDTLASCAQAGSLSAFPGMLTDSRSYLSYARHDFFRRILCSFLAQYVQDGTAAWEDVLQLAKMLCYENMHHLISTSNKNEEKKKK